MGDFVAQLSPYLVCVAGLFSIISGATRLYAQPNIGSGSFTITISAPQSVKLGEQVRVHVVLTNTSNQELFVRALGAAERHYTIHVHDKSGRDVPRTKLGQRVWPGNFIGSDAATVLKPAETVEESAVLTQIFDLHIQGKYEVQLSRSTTDNWRDESVFSNRITLTVTE